MHICHTIPTLAVSGGGPPRSVSQLCESLVLENLDVSIITSKDPKSQTIYLNRKIALYELSQDSLFCLSRARGFAAKIREIASGTEVDVIHQHGIWLRCSHETTSFAHDKGIPLVIAPRGMLEPWALNNSKWKKKLAWALFQKRDLHRATAFHATAQSEAESIRRLGFKQPIAVIPNGICLPEVDEGEWRMCDGGSVIANSGGRMAEGKGEEHLPSPIRHPSSTKTALFLSRINPKKGLPMLLDAWAKVAPHDWRLVIAGNDDSNHLPMVERKIRELGLLDRVMIAGPLFGAANEAAYRQADLFVLPSYSENFGIVVAEALGYGLPVLTTTGCPWQELETHNCGWWVEPTLEGVEQGLREALGAGSSELAAMGIRGRKLVEEKYQWPGIAERMLEFYDWLLNGGEKPDFVV